MPILLSVLGHHSEPGDPVLLIGCCICSTAL